MNQMCKEVKKMAYNLLKSQIKRGKMSKAELMKKANVFYMASQLSDDEYAEIMALIEAM